MLTSAMVLAAGRGERMGALTEHMPKPLLPIGRETLIARQIRRLAAAGVRDIVVNTSYRALQLREYLGDGARFDVQIRYSDEGEPPLETAGGIIRALPLLGAEPFIVVNADVVSDFEFAQLRPPVKLGTLVLVPNPPHHANGDFGIRRDGTASATAPLYTFAGISVMRPQLFAGQSDEWQKLRPILDAAVAEQALDAMLHRGLWIDVGTPERLLEAQRVLADESLERPDKR